jgi:hypothetical protein
VTMTALVLGMPVSSANASYQDRKNELAANFAPICKRYAENKRSLSSGARGCPRIPLSLQIQSQHCWSFNFAVS